MKLILINNHIAHFLIYAILLVLFNHSASIQQSFFLPLVEQKPTSPNTRPLPQKLNLHRPRRTRFLTSALKRFRPLSNVYLLSESAFHKRQAVKVEDLL